MNSTLKDLILEVLLESLWGQKFQIELSTGEIKGHKYLGIASKNVKPNERPFRISWFDDNLKAHGHIDMTWNEMSKTLADQKVPNYIAIRHSLKWDEPVYTFRILPFPSD